MNKAIIAGVVSEDPRSKKTHSGFEILEFPVVTTEDYRDKAGDERTREVRHNVVLYGRLAEKHRPTIARNTFVVVDGSISNEFLDKPEGGKGFRSEIVAKSLTYVI